MKKLFTITITLLSLLQLSAQNDLATKNGFSIDLEFGFPTGKYGAISKDQFDYDVIYGLQVGNRWYVKRFEKSGIAVMANWISAGFTQKKAHGITATGIELTFVEVGGMYSYAIGQDMAIDGYYNLEPTILITDAVNQYKDGNEGIGGYGFGHALGAAFRYKIFNVGLEYHFGSIEATTETLEDIPSVDQLPDGKIDTSHLKLVLGVKF